MELLYLKPFADDPKTMNKMKTSHREFLGQVRGNKPVVTIKDEEVQHQIDLNIRLMYLRDCTLPYYFEDRTNNLITTVAK